MINEFDSDSLIEYRLNQAFDNIELVRFLVSNDKLVIAVNRIYFGMYYSLTALALKDRFEASKHSQLICWFNMEYISSEKVDSRFGKILRNAYQNRTKGDDDACVSFSRIEVESMLSEMSAFITEIKRLLDI